MKKQHRFHYAWLILIGVCFMQAGGLGAVLDACGVFFVPVCEDLGFSRSEISSYLTFYFIASMFAMPIVGKWITKYNINWLLSIAFCLVVIALGSMSYYQYPWQWWISGIVFGFAGSFIFVIPGPILIDNWFYRHTGMALGVSMAFSGIGGAVLSPLFTVFIESFGWREAYLLAAIIIAIMVLPFTLFIFKLHPEDIGRKPYGWTQSDELALQEELTTDKGSHEIPGIPFKRAIKSIPFLCMFLFAGLIAYFAGFNSHLPGYAQSLGYPPLVASTMLTAVMVGNVIEKLIVGWLNDRIGVKYTIYIQLSMVAAGLVGLILSEGNLGVMYVSAFLFGAHNSLVSVSTPLIIRQLFGERDFPRLFAYARIGTGAIGCFGPATVGAIYDSTGGFTAAFLLGIGIVCASFFVVLLAYATRKSLKWTTGVTPEDAVAPAGGKAQG